MYRSILFAIFLTLLFYGCTPTETEDFYEANYSNHTLYRNYDTPGYWLVNVKAKYTAKVFKNGIQIGDTTYLNNALFYKDVSSANTVWQIVDTFGRDSLAVVLRNDDSVYIKYSDSLIYRIKFPSLIPVLIGVNHSVMNNSSSVSIGNSEIQKIDTLNSIVNKYLTYPKWKEAIQNKYF